MIRKTEGGVTAAKGFLAASCAAAIKYQGRDDMAMICSEVPCAVAGVFTSNRVKAAPVQWDMQIVRNRKSAQAVVVNSGIANAATGEKGLAQCEETAARTAELLQLPRDAVLVGSTGVIGPLLPMDRICSGIGMLAGALSSTAEAATAASRAIMTTDTVNKEFALTFDLPSADGKSRVPVHLGGMCKGSGMIHPNMCTMLAYLTTDCAIDQALLQRALSEVVQDTFNMLSVDGDTSTNDTLLVLANGCAGNRAIAQEGADYGAFKEALYALCREMTRAMAADGEGATHLIEMRVRGADTKQHARELAKSVVCSSLVKAMVFGGDANCGRILCALGYAGVDFDPALPEVWLVGEKESICFYSGGAVLDFDEETAARLMAAKEVRFDCDMHMGAEEATAWGCDLTHEYVTINGDYRS